MRQKAVEEKRQTAPDITGTSGQWTAIGPAPIQAGSNTYSGRVWGIAVDPRNSSVVYIGTDGGGVWKTTNGGTNWTPLTDQQANLNVRDLALAPSAPDTIFAGTLLGGMLKSTDGGATWTTSLPRAAVTSVAVHPTNASIVLETDYSLRRSADGGLTWILPLPTEYSCNQVVFDPANGNIAYVTVLLHGLYRSTDSGLTWNPVAGSGLPTGPYVYYVAIAPSSTNILYMAIKGNGHLIGFYRSADSGANWTQIGVPPFDDITYWGWSLRVHPTNLNLIYAGSLSLSMSTDGGKTWAQNDDTLHVDHHVQAYSADGNTLYIGNDGGIWKTSNPTVAHTSWTNLNATLNTVLFYPGISISPSTANISFGGTQDNGTLQYQGNLTWNRAQVCGDGASTAIDFEQPQNVYVSCFLPSQIFASSDGGQSFHIAQSGIGTENIPNLIPALVMDPSDHRRLYFGTNRVYQSLDGSGSWTAISPAFTQNALGIITIAVAPSDPNTVYAGMAGGTAFITRNALSGTGAAWTPRNLPVFQNITQIAVDPQNPMTAWAATVTIPGLNQGSVYRTIDGGVTWTSMSTGLPNIPVNDILMDPDIANTIYAATDIGVYRTVDGGLSWLPLGTALPNVICHSIKLHRASRTLRVATYGRGMWDLSIPLSPPAFITATGGTPQTTPVGRPFPAALQATVKDGLGNPMSGVNVSFTSPASGASAVLSTATAISNTSGVASVTASANNIAGSYSVTTGVGALSASFSLTNTSVGSSNLAQGKIATQSSTFPGYPTAGAPSAVDGSTDGSFLSGSVTHTNLETNPWWQVDLGSSATVNSLAIWNRTDCCGTRLADYWVFVSDTPFSPADTPSTLQNRAGTFSSHLATAPNPSTTVQTGGAQGRYVRVQLAGVNYLSLAEVQVIGTGAPSTTNLALSKTATQSSTLSGYATANASAAVDGSTVGNFFSGSVTHTDLNANPWWQVDLGASATVNSIAIWNRTDCCGTRLGDYWVFVSDIPFGPNDTPATLQNRAGTFSSHQATAPNPSTTIPVGATGRYVRVQLAGVNYLSLAEVQVIGTGAPSTTNLALSKPASQSSTLSGYATDAAGAAVDGSTDGVFFNGSVTHTNLDTNAWWQVDLGASSAISSVVIWNRTDCCSTRLNDYWVFVSDTPFSPSDTPATLQNRAGTFSSHQSNTPSPFASIPAVTQGRYVRVQLAGANYLSLAEVQVIGQ